jgi:hypothetical protein
MPSHSQLKKKINEYFCPAKYKCHPKELLPTPKPLATLSHEDIEINHKIKQVEQGQLKDLMDEINEGKSNRKHKKAKENRLQEAQKKQNAICNQNQKQSQKTINYYNQK